jgi:O-antigen/teichoic acid export membrane protein
MHANRLRALKNVAAGWLGLGASFLAGFFLTPIVLHHVGDTSFGIWILLTTFTGYYGLLDLGLRAATIRFVARAAALNDAEELNSVVSTSFFFYAVLSLAMMLVTAVVLVFFDRLFRVGPEWQRTGRLLLVIAGFGTAVTTPLSFFTSVLEGLQKFSVTGFTQTLNILIRAALVVIALEHGYKILGVGLITIGMNFVSAAFLTLIAFRVWPSLRIRRRYASWREFRTLTNYGLQGLWISIAQSIRFQFDSIVIGSMISAEAITFFSVGARLSV